MSTTSQSSNKQDKRITAEQTVILIRLIKKYKSLWDHKHPEFRNRTLREHLFEKIGKYFQLDGEETRRKFRRLRNCYTQELKQIQTEQKQFTRLFYFDEMEFLKDQTEQRLLKRRPLFGSPTSSPKEGGDIEQTPTELLEGLYTIEPTEGELPNTDSESNNEYPTAELESTPGIVLEELEVDKLPNEEEESENEQGSTLSDDKPDEFDIFAKYLASQLREMDKLSALETMEELQQIISQRRIGILKKNLKRNGGLKVQYRYSLKKIKKESEIDGE